MMLSDVQIMDFIDSGEIVIEPFKHKNLGPNSYDLTLHKKIMVPWTPENGEVDVTKTIPRYIEKELPYSIPPHGSIVVRSNEIIGVKEKTLGILSARSNLARLPLILSYSTLIDTGFKGFITAVLYNPNPFPVRIVPNYRFMQVMFDYVDGVISTPYDKRTWSKNLDQFGDIYPPGFKIDKEWRD